MVLHGAPNPPYDHSLTPKDITMPDYRRVFIPGGTYFLTVALLEWRLRLLTENIDALRQAFRIVKAERPFTIEAIAILPDHLHCLWTLPSDDTDYPTCWRLIKSRFSRRLGAGERLSSRRKLKREIIQVFTGLLKQAFTP